MSTLPDRPDLDQLKRQAKDLRKAVLRADEDALARARQYHPNFSRGADPTSFSLQNAQLVIAREHGLASWPKLVETCKRDAPGEAQIDSGSVPVGLSDISAGWLTATLRRSGALPQGEVLSFALAPCTGDSPAHGHTALLTLEYSRAAPASAPEKIYIQLSSHRGSRASIALLEAAQQSGHPSVLPALYGADYRGENGHSAILLQDLSASHTKAVCYPDVGGGHDLAGEIIDLMAGLHAYWWEHPRLDGPDFTRGSWPDGDAQFPLAYENHRIGLQHITATAEWLTGEDRRLCEELLRRLGPVWQAHFAPRLAAGKHITLVTSRAADFGDFLVPKNLQLVYAAAGMREQIFATADIPCTHFATQTLVQLLAQSWSPPQRAKRERGLLQRYWKTLCENGVKNYSWDDLWDDYRRMIPYFVFAIIARIARLGVDQRAHQRLDLNLSHLLVAYKDLDVDEVFQA